MRRLAQLKNEIETMDYQGTMIGGLMKYDGP